MPEYFFYYISEFGGKGYYLWRDAMNSRSMLYQKLGEGDYEGLPEGFRRLRRTLDMILDTLYIRDNLIPVQLSAEEIANNRAKRETKEDTVSDNYIPVPSNNTANIIPAEIARYAKSGIIQNNTKKTAYWFLLFLLIPFIFIILFLVKKRIKWLIR
jgi:hypothetical protein